MCGRVVRAERGRGGSKDGETMADGCGKTGFVARSGMSEKAKGKEGGRREAATGRGRGGSAKGRGDEFSLGRGLRDGALGGAE